MPAPNRLIPLIIASALFMENMDSTVIATSLPAIAEDLGTDPITLKLAFTTYLLSSHRIRPGERLVRRPLRREACVPRGDRGLHFGLDRLRRGAIAWAASSLPAPCRGWAAP